jgi:outer membrane protein
MIVRLVRIAVIVCLVASLGIGMPTIAQAPTPQQDSTQKTAATANGAVPYTSILFSHDYSKGHRSFPNLFAPYMSDFVPQPALTNGPTIYGLVHDGKLELSLQDAIALALENNLNIGVAEYTPWLDEANLLNALGGGTPLGQVAIGSGGGTFDPAIAFNGSVTDQSQTVINPLTSGVGTAGVLTQASHSTLLNLTYSQELHSGTNLTVVLDNTRASSSPSENFFNPYISSSLGVGIEQPLLNGWGFLPHTRFILEAKNTDKIGELQFEEQVISSVTQVETQYWILVEDQQTVEVAKQTLAAYQKLYDNNQKLLHIGSISPSDEVLSEAYIAQGNQALLGAQAAESQQEATVLSLITKDPADPRIKGVEIVATTQPEDAPQVPNISSDDAIKEAMANRPEVKVWQLTLKNDNYDVRATKNALLPTLDVTGEYVSSGLSGNIPGAFTPNGTFAPDLSEPIINQNGNAVSVNGIPVFLGVPNGAIGPAVSGGVGGAYSQIFHNDSPEYFGQLSLSLPLRNRSAQATNAETKLKEREDKVNNQLTNATIVTAVNQALSAVNLYAEQVQSAVKATELYQRSYDYIVTEFNLGDLPTQGTYFIANYASSLSNAKLNELTAKASYEIALANFNMALGRTLTANSITIAGNRKPTFDFDGNAPLIPGTLDGHLAGDDVFSTGQHR